MVYYLTKFTFQLLQINKNQMRSSTSTSNKLFKQVFYSQLSTLSLEINVTCLALNRFYAEVTLLPTTDISRIDI